jgi:hypothetical protein
MKKHQVGTYTSIRKRNRDRPGTMWADSLIKLLLGTKKLRHDEDYKEHSATRANE